MDIVQGTVLVPCVRLGIGTQTATIRDAVARSAVDVEGVDGVVLVGRVACLELPFVSEAGPLRLALLPGGRRVWVSGRFMLDKIARSVV